VSIQTLAQVLQELGEPNPDLFLAGDGSGSGWKTTAGWACFCIDCFTGERTSHYGGLSMGSINMVELFPYIHALVVFHENGRGKSLLASRGHCRVVVLTDSGYVASAGAIAADVNQVLPTTHSALWSCIRQFARLGYLIRFHHRHRSTTAMNQWADLVSSVARKSVVKAIEENMDQIQPQIIEQVDLRYINP
jgi:hypothetical protein